MKKPTLLCNCKSKLDAYFLKNIIQKIAVIPVSIRAYNREIHLIVDDSNFTKANLILLNQLALLPSSVAIKCSKNVEDDMYSINLFQTIFSKIEEYLIHLFLNRSYYYKNPELQPLKIVTEKQPFNKYKKVEF